MRSHPFAPASLLFGLVFAGVGGTFLVGNRDVWHLDWSWVWPVALVVAGLIVLASARPRTVEPDPPVEPLVAPDEPLDGPVL